MFLQSVTSTYNQAWEWIQSFVPGTPTPSNSSDNRKWQCSRVRGQRAEEPRMALLAFTYRHWINSNISMIFTPNGKLAQSAAHPWYAVTLIQAHDLSATMKEGLYWTQANLDLEAGYFTCNPRKDIDRSLHSGIFYARVYHFRNLSAEVPSWTAQLTVLFTSIESAAQFRFDQLTVDHIALCQAWNKAMKDVYRFRRDQQTPNVNTLYEDMPLKGWWPWPKAYDESKSDLLL